MNRLCSYLYIIDRQYVCQCPIYEIRRDALIREINAKTLSG